jgi:hypothetical protein
MSRTRANKVLEETSHIRRGLWVILLRIFHRYAEDVENRVLQHGADLRDPLAGVLLKSVQSPIVLVGKEPVCFSGLLQHPFPVPGLLADLVETDWIDSLKLSSKCLRPGFHGLSDLALALELMVDEIVLGSVGCILACSSTRIFRISISTFSSALGGSGAFKASEVSVEFGIVAFSSSMVV